MGRRRHGGGFDGARPRRIRRFVEPAVLLLLHREPNHGYGLLEGLHDLGLERYPMDVSAIYRILYDLEANGMVVSQAGEGSAGPPRRVYALTAQGDAYLAAWVEDLRLTDQILHRFFQAYDVRKRDAAEGHTQDLDGPAASDETSSQSTTQE